ncbi:hypothetical protein ACHQM5_022584 [Ranunculus cassubicifolius]
MIELKTSTNHLIIPSRFFVNFHCIRTKKCSEIRLISHSLTRKYFKYCARRDEKRRRFMEKRRGMVPCCSTSSTETGVDLAEEEKTEIEVGQFENLVNEFGWRVRRLVAEKVEMRKVARVQAEAFHVPVALFNDLFLEFFKAEVLASLIYKLRNSPEDRYACLVAEPTNASEPIADSRRKLVGVVDITVLNDKSVLSFLDGSEEYLYISGIAVLEEFRRRKVATVLLKACDLLSRLWGYEYLVLRAYDDDAAALTLYTNAGYRIVTGDPPWLTSWIGRKRRVLMVKQSSVNIHSSNS